MTEKLHRIVPEDIYRVAQIVDILRDKYGPARTAYMLEKVALALKKGMIGGGPSKEFFVSGGL